MTSLLIMWLVWLCVVATGMAGYIAHTAPTIDGGGGPGWSGFICVMPWELYLTSGDIRPLRDAFPHQVKLLRFWNRARSASDGLIHDWSTVDRWAFLGDWISPVCQTSS